MSGFEIDDWHNLYGDGWKGEIVPDAFTHPAKFSRALIRHIYEHCASEGWLNAGDSVVDPFGGVALGALDAMRLGLHWVGLELEPRFVDLGGQNIAGWNRRYKGRFTKWGTARLLQGDSRNLYEAMTGWQTCAVSSPPYATSDQNYKAGWARFHAGHAPLWRNDAQREAEYGDTPGQIFAMPAGRFDAAISSPPFMQSGGGVGVKPGAKPGSILADPRIYARHAAGNSAAEAYGTDPANLGNLPAGEFGAAVSSPPYEASVHQSKKANDATARLARKRAAGLEVVSTLSRGGPYSVLNQAQTYDEGASQTPGLAGSLAGADFWTAARAIVEQTYAVLAPGGHACWVVKNFVRDWQIVPFTDQWRQLCEAVGFVTLHEHRAWLVEDHGTQMAHDGNHKAHRTERKSFFRRLAEKKGSPRIDWESVLCMVKPDSPPMFSVGEHQEPA